MQVLRPDITLNAEGRLTRLPSEELMLTSWVPREAGVTVMNIPPDLDFLADVAHTIKYRLQSRPGL